MGRGKMKWGKGKKIGNKEIKKMKGNKQRIQGRGRGKRQKNGKGRRENNIWGRTRQTISKHKENMKMSMKEDETKYEEYQHSNDYYNH